MKWEMAQVSKTMFMFHRTITQDVKGRDVELYLEFQLNSNKCVLHFAVDGSLQTASDIPWEQGMELLERDGCREKDQDLVEHLYDYA